MSYYLQGVHQGCGSWIFLLLQETNEWALFFFLQTIQSFNFYYFLRIFHIALYNSIDFTQEETNKKVPIQKNPETHVSLFVKRKCFL